MLYKNTPPHANMSSQDELLSQIKAKDQELQTAGKNHEWYYIAVNDDLEDLRLALRKLRDLMPRSFCGRGKRGGKG